MLYNKSDSGNPGFGNTENNSREAQQFLAAMRLNAMARGIKWIDTYRTFSSGEN